MTRREWAAHTAFTRPPIRLRMLGAVDLCDHDGRALDAILAQPRRLGLLAYFAMSSRNGFVRRDQAIALFWPEQDAEHARAALTRAIYYLRQSLGDGVLISRGSDEIHLAEDRFWCDAVALDGAIVDGRHEDALALYRGELLDGFFVSNAPGFERWLDGERRRLGDIVFRSASSLAAAAERCGDHTLAARWCRWALERSPLDEPGVQRLMIALDRAGDRAGAVLAYEQFAHRIARELELTPSPETRALLEVIRRRGMAGSRPALGLAAGERPGADAADAVRAQPVLVGSMETVQSPRALRARWSRFGMATFAATVAVAGGSVGFMLTRAPSFDSRRVAVMSIGGTVDDIALDSLARRANVAIHDALARTGLMVVVLPPSPSTSRRESAAAPDSRGVAEQTRAGAIVLTSLRRDRDSVLIDARIIEPLGSKVRWVIAPARGAASAPGPAIDEIAQRAAGAIAVLRDRRFASWLPVATSPPTLRAYEEFDRGTDLKLRNRPADALIHFERAVALDPTFTWALMEAAITHMNVGDRVGADSIADILNAARDRLSSVERDWLDWMRAVREEDWTRSYVALERAARLVPDRFLYLLAENARWLNWPRRSIELLERLGPDNPASAGFGYWYLMADSYHQLRDHVRELDFARRGRQRQPGRLTAVIVEARARAALGDVAGVLALADTVLTFPRDGRDTPGTMMLQAAEELRAHGHQAASAVLLDRAIRWFRDRPASEGTSMELRRQFARATYDAGRWTDAEALFRQLVVSDRDGATDHRAMLGAIAAHRGDTVEARRVVETLRELTRSIHRPREDAMFGQARILAVLGDSRESVRLLREALGGQGQDLHTEADFEILSADPAFRLFVRPKG